MASMRRSKRVPAQRRAYEGARPTPALFERRSPIRHPHMPRTRLPDSLFASWTASQDSSAALVRSARHSSASSGPTGRDSFRSTRPRLSCSQSCPGGQRWHLRARAVDLVVPQMSAAEHCEVGDDVPFPNCQPACQTRRTAPDECDSPARVLHEQDARWSVAMFRSIRVVAEVVPSDQHRPYGSSPASIPFRGTVRSIAASVSRSMTAM